MKRLVKIRELPLSVIRSLRDKLSKPKQLDLPFPTQKEVCAQTTEMLTATLKNCADKSDLLSFANNLETISKSIRDIAKSM